MYNWIPEADNRNDSVTQSNTPLPNSAVQNSQRSHALATEHPVHANRQNNTVSAQLLPPLSTLPLTGEHSRSSKSSINSASFIFCTEQSTQFN